MQMVESIQETVVLDDEFDYREYTGKKIKKEVLKAKMNKKIRKNL